MRAAQSSLPVGARAAQSSPPDKPASAAAVVLPSVHRMRRSPDFVRAMRTGRRAGRRTLVVHVAAVEGSQDPVRVGFVVSRAVGGAVTRNQVKRRLRAHMKDRLEGLRRGGLVVVRALPPAGQASFAALGADLDAALGSALRTKEVRS